MPIITELKEKGNMALARLPKGTALTVIVLLTSLVSFGLGYLSGKDASGAEIIIETRSREESASKEPARGSSLEAAVLPAVSAGEKKELPPPPEGGGSYVASKTGKSYHLPWCPGAKQIKEGNKIFFATKEEAEAAGYTPAKNCKGI